jgi:hypothetical protein
LPTERKPLHRASRSRLTDVQEMTLQYGPSPRWNAFDSEEEHASAWARNRDRFLAHYRRGRRPMAWWRFEAGDLRYPGYDRERSVLYEAGLLGDAELRELVSEWRRQFLRTYEPNFFFTDSPDRILRGAAARQAHFDWADIPDKLIEQWTEERRHRPAVAEQVEGAAS